MCTDPLASSASYFLVDFVFIFFVRHQPLRTASFFCSSSLILYPLPHNYRCLCPQPIALKVHGMSSLTHLRRQRKERGGHWDNTRRNKVMFRGKHSLGIVLYLFSHPPFCSFLLLLFRHVFFPPFFPSLCVCFVCLMTPSFF